MAPFVVNPPIQIDPSAQKSGYPNYSTATIVTNNSSVTPRDVDAGPWKAPNGALYCLLMSLASNNHLNVFKSIDGGVTWVQQDVAHTPDIGSGGGFYNAQFNTSTGVLTMAYGTGSSTPNTISWASYSTVTDLFTATIHPDVTDVNSGPDFVVRGDGSVVFLYQQNTGKVGVRTNTGGAWSAFTDVTPATAGHTYIPAGTYLDSAQTTHVIYIDYPPAAAPRRYNDVAWSSVNVKGATALIFTEDVFNGATLNRGAIFGTSLLLPVTQQNVAGTQSRAQVYAGTPLNAPVYTPTTLETVAVVLNPAIDFSHLQVYAGTAYLSWNAIPDTTVTDQMHYAVNSGSGWGPVGVFYDALTNPPNAVIPANQAIADVSILSGSLFGLATMAAVGGGLPAFFLIGSGPPILTIRFGGIKVYS